MFICLEIFTNLWNYDLEYTMLFVRTNYMNWSVSFPFIFLTNKRNLEVINFNEYIMSGHYLSNNTVVSEK